MLPDCLYLGLGGNQAASEAALVSAVDAVSKFWKLRSLSSLYLTEAQDYKNQAPFLNVVGAWELPASADPADCLATLMRIEKSLGRQREGALPKGPRLIDLDILLFGNRIVDQNDLTIPHPRMRDRRFALEPLLEIAPDLWEPGSSIAYAEYLKAISGQAIYSKTALKYTNPSV